MQAPPLQTLETALRLAQFEHVAVLARQLTEATIEPVEGGVRTMVMGACHRCVTGGVHARQCHAGVADAASVGVGQSFR
jgi:hypothetical protein